jgi:hypothetical protein
VTHCDHCGAEAPDAVFCESYGATLATDVRASMSALFVFDPLSAAIATTMLSTAMSVRRATRSWPRADAAERSTVQTALRPSSAFLRTDAALSTAVTKQALRTLLNSSPPTSTEAKTTSMHMTTV